MTQLTEEEQRAQRIKSLVSDLQEIKKIYPNMTNDEILKIMIIKTLRDISK